MENLKFDLTNEQGIKNTIALLEEKSKHPPIGAVGKIGTIDFQPFFNFLSQLCNRFIDLFDSSKKMETQMRLAIETIEIARKLGAKRIEIIIDKRNDSSFKAHIKEIDASAKAKKDTGGTITYIVDFA